jgi:hypothetical protein
VLAKIYGFRDMIRRECSKGQARGLEVERKCVVCDAPCPPPSSGDPHAKRARIDDTAREVERIPLTKIYRLKMSRVNVSGTMDGRGRGFSGVGAGAGPNCAVTV